MSLVTGDARTVAPADLSANPLVSPRWLADHLDQVTVVDCRFSLPEPELGRRQYAAGHIPNAYYLDLNRDLSSPVQAHGGRHPLPDWPRFAKRLELLGICSSPQTPVVAYDASRFAFAARLWWMLRYLGHANVALLDGGIAGWQAAGLALSQDIPPFRTGAFEPRPQSGWIANIEALRHPRPGTLIVDSRSADRYRGEREPIDPVAGSVPGAVNYFWQQVSTAEGYLHPSAVLAQHWAALDSADETIVYCGSGVTACVNLFSQAVAGKPMGRLYPGGWSDWCSYQ